MTINGLDTVLALMVGLGATLLMDLWLMLRARFFKVPSLNYCFLGRWILHMQSGVLVHVNIAKAPQKAWECAVGRLAHYVIGALFGFALVVLASRQWLLYPTLIPALLWGLLTVAAPFFVMQPALGFGIAASKAPDATRARIHSVLTHTVYGFGLYLSALIISLFL